MNGRFLFLLLLAALRFVAIEAQNHHFDGNTDQFSHNLREGRQWVDETPR